MSAQTSYLVSTMLRQLLTLLALFTGLAAAGEPAHARISGVENVRLAYASETPQSCIERCSPLAAQLARYLERQPENRENGSRTWQMVALPGVIPGVDRAHE
ncbi:hypothetical protein D6851_12920 [Altericroceibacterium spongiae]|uniref:Uncharacterized protein n=1 Tax=Altericroceibacterium spongiae TaxID=2320269 RepID=A0A420EF73_9SPHN|nr:hypothetical protein [Altericroceibacterium spongiae]RKF19347.1 hypothetical protein D6851_12920 [Altericroceibacterium spongiae]